jgi:hypothetical protein
MNTLSVGSLVTYNSIQSGGIKGKIISNGRDQYGPFVRIKVTAKSHSAYPVGTVFVVGSLDNVTAR